MSDVVATNAEILVALRTFETVGQKDIPNIKANYALTKARRKATEASRDLEVLRIQLCEKHSAKNEDGTAKKTTVQNDRGEDVEGYDLADKAAFQAEYNALLAVSVTLEGTRAVTIEELSGTTLTGDELAGLGPLVIE